MQTDLGLAHLLSPGAQNVTDWSSLMYRVLAERFSKG